MATTIHSTTRRNLLGASGALLLTAGPAVAALSPANPDTALFAAIAAERSAKAKIDHIDSTTGWCDAEIDAASDAWEEAKDDLAETPALTPEGLRAKAAVARANVLYDLNLVIPQRDQLSTAQWLALSVLGEMVGEA